MFFPLKSFSFFEFESIILAVWALHTVPRVSQQGACGKQYVQSCSLKSFGALADHSLIVFTVLLR